MMEGPFHERGAEMHMFDLSSYTCEEVSLFTKYVQYGELKYHKSLCRAMVLCDMLGVKYNHIEALLIKQADDSISDRIDIYQTCIDNQNDALIVSLRSKLYPIMCRVAIYGPTRIMCTACDDVYAFLECNECRCADIVNEKLTCTKHCGLDVSDYADILDNVDCDHEDSMSFVKMSDYLSEDHMKTLDHFIQTEYVKSFTR